MERKYLFGVIAIKKALELESLTLQCGIKKKMRVPNIGVVRGV